MLNRGSTTTSEVGQTDLGAHPSHFRSSPSNRHEATAPACRFRAISGLMRGTHRKELPLFNDPISHQ
jgi:hypothetical protein